MAIGSDVVALQELLASLDRALDAAYAKMAGGVPVDDVLDARIRVREIQSRREHVIRRLQTLAQPEAEPELKDSGERSSVEEEALPRDEAGVRRA